jgi:hypothetical protein
VRSPARRTSHRSPQRTSSGLSRTWTSGPCPGAASCPSGPRAPAGTDPDESSRRCGPKPLRRTRMMPERTPTPDTPHGQPKAGPARGQHTTVARPGQTRAPVDKSRRRTVGLRRLRSPMSAAPEAALWTSGAWSGCRPGRSHRSCRLCSHRRWKDADAETLGDLGHVRVCIGHMAGTCTASRWDALSSHWARSNLPR